MSERLHPLPLSLLEPVRPIDDVTWCFSDGTLGKVWNAVRLRNHPNFSPENTVRALSSIDGNGIRIGQMSVGLAQDRHPAFQAAFQKEIWGNSEAVTVLSDSIGQRLNKIIQETWNNPFYVVFMVNFATYAASLKRTDLGSHNGYFPFVVQYRDQIGLPPEDARLVPNFLVRRQRPA